MYRIIDKRNSGKTGRLMLLAKEHNGIVVCENPYAMRTKSYGYGISGVDFISYWDYINHNYDENKPIFIDEIESFVKKVHTDLAGYSVSVED